MSEYPSDWEITNLGNLATIKASNVDKKTKQGQKEISLCNYMDVFKNPVVSSTLAFMRSTASEKEISEFSLFKGDVLLTKDSEVPEEIGIPSVVTEDIPNLVCGYHLYMLRADRSRINPEYLCWALRSNSSRQYFYQMANGSTRFGLNLKHVEESPIAVPPLPEQKKIAEILSGIDHALQKLQERVAKSRDLAKSVSCELISGRISSSGYKMSEHGRIPADWEIKELDDCLDLYNCQSQTDGEYEVLTSASKGLMRQSEYHGANRITQRDSTGFNIIPSGYITYRSRSDSNSFYFNLNKLGITGLVSKYYPVFRPKSGMQASDFFCLLLNHYSPLLSRESVGTSQVVLSFNALKKVALPIPPLAEQLKISTAIASLKEMIKREEAKVATLIELKASISSDLLSGRKRVSV